MSQGEGGRVYRAAIIGCGRIADTIEDEVLEAPYWSTLPFSHAGAYARCPRTRLVAAADPNEERLASIGRRRGVAALYRDYRELLAREAPEIVSICVPTRHHGAVALEVARHPVRAIYLEKPIAQSLAEADRMVAAFRAAGIAVAVNHVRTFDPVYGRVRRLIAEGVIGAPQTVVAHWREGALFGGSHLFDLLRFLLGAEPVWAFAELDAGSGRFDPGARGLLLFPDDVLVYLDIADGQAVGCELDIVGTEGRIRVGNSLYPEVAVVDRSGARPLLSTRPFPGVTDGRSGMLRAVEALVDAVETGSRPLSTAEDARAALEIAVALHLSARERRPVALPLPAEASDFVIEDPWGRDA